MTLHERVLERSAQVDPDNRKPLLAMAASSSGRGAGSHGVASPLPVPQGALLTPSEFRATTRLTLCRDLPEIAQAIREKPRAPAAGRVHDTRAVRCARAMLEARKTD